MDRQFIVSGTIAAAIHVGLLSGIAPSKTDRVVTDVVKPPMFDPIKHVLVFTLEPPLPDVSETKMKRGSLENAPPVLPEPPAAAAPTVFQVTTPEAPVSSIQGLHERVPLGAIGLPTGSLDGTGFKPGDVIGSGLLDRAPRTLSQTPPAYPFEAKRNSLSGTVTVEFLVDETGSVVSPRVTGPSDRIFDEAALRAVARWRFEPGRKDGRVVRFRMAVPVVFTLNGD